MASPDPTSGKPRMPPAVLILMVFHFVLFGVLLLWVSSVVRKRPEGIGRDRDWHPSSDPAPPAWLPVYPGTAVRGPASPRQGKVSLYTEDPPERVLDFYAWRLRANGFEVEPRTKQGKSLQLHAWHRDGSELTVQAGGSHIGTWILLTYKDEVIRPSLP
jgi:hypothetical protein